MQSKGRGEGFANQPSLIARPPIGGQHFLLSSRVLPRDCEKGGGTIRDTTIRIHSFETGHVVTMLEGRLMRFECVAIMTGGRSASRVRFERSVFLMGNMFDPINICAG